MLPRGSRICPVKSLRMIGGNGATILSCGYQGVVLVDAGASVRSTSVNAHKCAAPDREGQPRSSPAWRKYSITAPLSRLVCGDFRYFCKFLHQPELIEQKAWQQEMLPDALSASLGQFASAMRV